MNGLPSELQVDFHVLRWQANFLSLIVPCQLFVAFYTSFFFPSCLP